MNILSLTHPHIQISTRISIFNVKMKKTNKQENKNTKKEKESKDDKRTSVKKKI